ncbi:hypothetical protein M9H77_33617 [Catharanthus roseus]|uniref:Uncharacterized protein n=1 Tax=Catharanthus roseus TaxID=4058 RepID=A0ACB9ZN30_CATRO|nr:hypothetical protein M9H77_33617 [Catharanthus roseus]
MKMMMTTKKKSCVLTARLLKNRKLQIKVNVAATAINNNSSLKKEPENHQVLEKKKKEKKKTELASAAATNIGLKKRKQNNDSLQINGDQSCNKKQKCNSTSADSSITDLSKKNAALKGNDDDVKKMRQERAALLEGIKKRQLDKQRQASRMALEEMRRKAELEVEDNFKTMRELEMLMNSSSSESGQELILVGAHALLKLKEEEEASDDDNFDAERVVLLEKRRQLDKQREASRIALEEVRRKAELEVEDNFKIMRDFNMLINSCSSSGWDEETISNNLGPKFQHLLW